MIRDSCSEKEKQPNKLPAAYCQRRLITSANFRPGNIVDNVISETWEVLFGRAICTMSVSGVSLLSLAATFTALSSSPRTNYLKLMKVDFLKVKRFQLFAFQVVYEVVLACSVEL